MLTDALAHRPSRPPGAVIPQTHWLCRSQSQGPTHFLIQTRTVSSWDHVCPHHRPFHRSHSLWHIFKRLASSLSSSVYFVYLKNFHNKR